MRLEDKKRLLQSLSDARRQDRCGDHLGVADFYAGQYDTPDFVSPWTRSACNLQADLMLVAQDWASEDGLRKGGFNEALARLGFLPHLPTNVNLQRLLKAHLATEFESTYATNLFVFVKRGGMNAPIPMKDLVYSATTYTAREIQIVAPKLVICLGAGVLRVINKVLGLAPIDVLRSAEAPSDFRGTRICGVFHPGGLGTAEAGGAAHVDAHWRRIARLYQDLLR